MKAADIAKSLDMPLRVVQRVLQTWEELGEVCRDRHGMGRAPLLGRHAVKLMLALIERTPDIYLDEIHEQLYELHDRDVSLATVWRTLRRLGITSKKLSRAAAERCAHARRAFAFEIGAEPPERIVAADESAVNLLTSYRENGWAFRGVRARKSTNFVRGPRFSMLPAITINGIIYSHIKKGSYNGDDFLDWLRGLLRIMNPYPGPQSVLVLDNCGIHHVPEVEELCEERGVKLMYLPPYSPDLNPDEECFSFVKSYIRRHGTDFRNVVEGDDLAAPYIFLYEVLDQVTPEAAQGWFHHSGYI